MSRIISKNAQIMVDAGNTPTATQIDALSSWDADFSKAEVDTTGIYDDNKQYVPGQGDAKGSLTIICDPASTTLTALETAQKGNSLINLYVRLEGTASGKSQIKIPAYITGYKINGGVDARVEVAVTWVAGGNIDYTTQTA